MASQLNQERSSASGSSPNSLSSSAPNSLSTSSLGSPFSPRSDYPLEGHFHDSKPLLNETEAVTEANRCLYCFDAPCIQACPTGINIPQFIGRIATGNPVGSAKTILDSNILGHSCAVSCPTEVLCEGACVYSQLNKEPIHIGKLQRYAVDHVYQQGIRLYQPGAPTGKRVALVGAGPASLACAHELRKQGHEAVIFEKLGLPGGLNTFGIAPYKMKSAASLREIEEIAAMGVQFQMNRELGRNLHLNELLEEYDAVFLGLGLGPDTSLTIPGSHHEQIQGAVDFISRMKASTASQMPGFNSDSNRIQSALVVGGGNTALDACRELKFLGVPRVIVSYRRTESEMSGYQHEFKQARQQGVEFWFNTVPVEFKTDENSPQGHSVSVLLHQKPDATQKQLKQNGDVTPLKIDVDLVLLAIGQSKLVQLLSKIPKLQFELGRLKINPKTGQTDHPKIYAGGDLTNGGKEVVNAVAEGKTAALAIHKGITHG